MNDSEAVVFMLSLLVLAGVAVLWMAMQNRRLVREMEHRERLAMIERGMVPPPERDPATFERGTGLSPALSRTSARWRSAGILLIGLGLALMMLISFVGDAPEAGVGVGGAFALLGGAFIFNSLVMAKRDPYAPPSLTSPPRPTPPVRPSEPPDQLHNIS